MDRYAYHGSLNDLINECRGIVARHSVAPAQRQAILQHQIN